MLLKALALPIRADAVRVVASSWPKHRLLIVSIVVLMMTLLQPAAASLTAQEFFDSSNPTLVYRNETQSYHLLLTTPLPILCAVHYGRIPDVTDDTTTKDSDIMSDSKYDGVTTMPMSFPAEFHDVEVPFQTGDGGDTGTTEHRLILTAFVPNSYNDILRSPIYHVVADPTSPSIATMEILDDDNTNKNEASSIEPAECPYDLLLGNVTSNSASFELSAIPPLPTLHSLAYASAGSNIIDLTRAQTTTVDSMPTLELSALDSATIYNVAGCFIDTEASVCCAQPVPLTFTTAEAIDGGGAGGGTEESEGFGEECYDDNVALIDKGATVMDVSTNYGNGDMMSGFGGNKAIDGRSASAWSSFGDGDDAYILIKLAEPVPIAGVGVWSREMVGSSEILSFRLTLSNSLGDDRCITFVGPFDLPDTKSLYKFNLMDKLDDGKVYDEIRLDVESSTGGNTGLRTLEVYPMSEDCGARSSSLEDDIETAAHEDAVDELMVSSVPADDDPTNIAPSLFAFRKYIISVLTCACMILSRLSVAWVL